MEDIGEIITVIASLAVVVLGFVAKGKKASTKKLVGEAGNEPGPVREDAVPFSGRPLSAPRPAESFEEGQRAFEDSMPGTPADTKGHGKKPDIDKKKLIIYSELLKPKFDE